MKTLGRAFLSLYFLLACLPLAWLGMTSLKTRDQAIATHTVLLFRPQAGGFLGLAEPHAGTIHSFYHYLGNSLWIALLSTLAALVMGTATAYGFSRFRIPGSADWLFFILSTRFMPPLAVVAPILILFRALDLPNTALGLIILYTGFNLSLAVWLMKGFLDDIPRAFEEAALVDGYSPLQALFRVVLPQARRGMAVTAVFCLISAWNEYGFAMTLNNAHGVTVPVYFAGLQGNIGGLPWPQITAGVLIFVAPMLAFTVLVRKHLLRGMTFGTIKQ